ncbi:MAG: hypothetical protein IJ882_06000, partial [Paludibacteraceae bacterium]|nr:hypothetical protein [Paludibacteraceae bacterium]
MLEKVIEKLFGKGDKGVEGDSSAAIEPEVVTLTPMDLKRIKSKREQRRKERLHDLAVKQLPRTIDDMVFAGGEKGSFAMDAGLQNCEASRDRIRLDSVVLDRMTDYFIGWQSMALLKQNWLIDRACTIPAEDAIAPGWQLSYIDSADADGEIAEETQREQMRRIQEMEDSARRMGIAEICKKAEVLKKTFGY